MAAARNSRLTDLSGALRDFFAARLEFGILSGRRVCVGLSGGRDSVVLLHALSGLRDSLSFDLSAIHVHHGLSPHADRWTAFCEEFCASLAVPLRVVRVAVQETGEGLEAAARHARYAAFAECEADWLALAHHQDDQAETLLLNLLRGAGAEGLAAMPAERRQGERRLVRPLLGVPRAAIEAWAAAHGLGWVEDESNDDTALRRNFLRHEILPRLNEAFTGATKALANTAGLMGETVALLDELAVEDRARVSAGGVLRLAPFNALSAQRRANLLRHEIRRQGLRMPDARYLGEMLRQLVEAGADSAPRFALDGGLVAVYRDGLFVVPAIAPGGAAVWQGEPVLPWAGAALSFTEVLGAGLSRARLGDAPLQVRIRAGGETFRTHPGRPRRCLKKLFQELGVPPWWRECLPLLWCGNDLVWVAGLGVAPDYRAAPGEAGVLPAWSALATPA